MDIRIIAGVQRKVNHLLWLHNVQHKLLNIYVMAVHMSQMLCDRKENKESGQFLELNTTDETYR